MKNIKTRVIFFLLIVMNCNIKSQSNYNDFPDSLKLTVFVENFESNNNNWILQNDWLNGNMRNGRYTITCKNFNNSNALSYKPVQLDASRDFDLEAEVSVLKGNGGIILGMNEKYDHYRIEINDNNELYIVKSIASKGELKIFRSKRYPDLIKVGGYNKLTIRHIKNKFQLFVDGKFIRDIEELQIFGNNYGISAGLNSEMSISDLRISYLNSVASKKQQQVAFQRQQQKFGYPDLSTSNIVLIDANNNNAIDENEEATLSFDIINSGKKEGEAVKAYIVNNERGVTMVDSIDVGTINPGEVATVKIPIKGNKDILNGLINFKIGFSEKLGLPPDTLQISLATRKTQLPLIKTVDYLMLTDNGTVRLGKTVILKALIQNIGMGKAENVSVEFGLPQTNVIANSENIVNVGILEVGDTALVSFEFIPNKLYKAPTIPLVIKTSEKTGKFAESLLVDVPVNSVSSSSKIVAMGNDYDQNSSSYKIRVASFKTDDGTASTTAKIISIGDTIMRDEIIKARQIETKIETSEANINVDNNIPQNNVENIHRYALIIGNEDYSSFQTGLRSESNVEFAINDATIFAEYANKTLGVPKNQIKLLSNATYAQMNQGINWLINLSKLENGNAEVIFYYSGHGLPDENTKEAYFIPVDVSGSDVQQGIKLDAVIDKFSQTPAQRITMFIDACFSGGARNEGLLSMKGVKIKPKEAQVGGNLVIYTSSTGEESSGIFRENKHGYFTYFLLKKIQESQGNISYKSLAEYVMQSVMKETGIQGKIQTPKVFYSPVLEEKWENWMIK